MDIVWDILNKIAIIGTIIGVPLTIYGIYNLIYGKVVIYDMYREPNESGGYTFVIGTFTRRDRKKAIKENSCRKYHKKGLEQNNERNWV